ncbi:lytic transglycosylase domain-containing protein [Thermosipho ferrireducens]|uniref:Lytic transglycosylase domain-containing protein n=1 Tax=Thermosipho ferrireducens TaxID=2571116 RepID=A0ABX7S8F0_9BACT|nr:lytic transglycosylase domain-containing protein [Thermosipho ferrireducens]QTA38872.1 lytic transglycosylase domain-containing protein [Thermosipho ferrireducens]
MIRLTFILILIWSTLFAFAFVHDPVLYLTSSRLNVQFQFYTNGVQFSIYNPIVYRIVSFNTFTKNMRYPSIVKGLAYLESGFNIHALSGVGAMGIAQFKDIAAKDYGVSNAWNPSQALNGADRMLRFLVKEYGSLEKALAIYNVGASNYKESASMRKAGKNYAQKVFSLANKISNNSSLYDRYVLYISGGYFVTEDSTLITAGVGGMWSILGTTDFDVFSDFEFSKDATGVNISEVTIGADAFVRLSHFNSLVFGYRLGYNNSVVKSGPVLGYFHTKPVGYNFGLKYDFSEGFDISAFSIIVGYGAKSWRLGAGYDSLRKNIFFELRF